MVEQIRAWIDSIFAPIHSPLDLAIDTLRDVQNVTAQGIDLGQYFSFFRDLPMTWQGALASLMASMVIIGGCFIFRSIMRVYFAKKDAIKWW
ncbi:hypothetical protein [Halalkalibacter hemicellulosilyticus]|uniref:Uncharacterized protein n=1 Tax=Halalkalibacter hemicellulosilyticusJCM 9152 TaxID=1236971 RepID=W4QLA6_9BACI|nr:hypothetical protein [Halalkalibacter hemicellulosilyticus]GAE32871.1 hypothetical protein JCM9152_4462 [Halalkalibacter hemicellulosilyticusJCM 9152]